MAGTTNPRSRGTSPSQGASVRRRPVSNGSRGKGRKSLRKATPRWLTVLKVFFMLVSLLAAVSLCVTAYAGNVSPVTNSAVWGILPLCFWPVALLTVILLLCQIGWNRGGIILIVLGMLISAGPLLTLCPLHIFSPSVPEDSETLSLLTYNVHNFDLHGKSSGEEISSYILEQDADVVCLQECGDVMWKNIPKARRDSLHKAYPYVFHGGYAQTTLSKYPLAPIHINLNRSTFGGGDLAIYRLTMADGRLLTLFNVHLASYNLTKADRELYRDLTQMKPEDPSEIKDQLLTKLAYASRDRARESRQLTRYVRLYGGPNVIIAGDFNDVPDCYTIRMLDNEAGFKDVYPRVGFGPMITFHANRFYFCIDHVLYRGALKPLSLKKGTLKASDHYPLTIRFALTNQKAENE